MSSRVNGLVATKVCHAPRKREWKRAEKIPDLPISDVHLAQLRKGVALIAVNGFEWHPTPERVAKARKIIEDASALAGIMSKAIRNKTSLSDANDVFNKTEDTLGCLELDEP